MKLTPGGKLSITLTAGWAALTATLSFAGDYLSHQIAGGFAVAVIALSFPLGWLGLEIAPGHGTGNSIGFAYFFLMVPNFFLLGYSIVGVSRLFWKREAAPAPTAVSSDELKKLLDEHRGHNA